MAGNIQPKYGTSGQVITITLASLASSTVGVGRASTVVDNTTNLFSDVEINGFIKSNAAGTSTTGFVNIYLYGTADGGTTYTENATGTDAGLTLTQPTNAQLIGQINVVANGITYKFGPICPVATLGGRLPDHWGIIVVNSSGAALDSTGANHAVKYQGVYDQYT